MSRHIRFVVTTIAVVAVTTAVAARVNRPEATAAEALARARNAMGFQRLGGRILHWHAATASQQAYQSDRTYPPYFAAMIDEDAWFDASTRVLRTDAKTVFPGFGPGAPSATIDDGVNAVVSRGERTTPLARRLATERGLTPWAVVADWSAAAGVAVAQPEMYRDYRRDVLVRDTPEGRQRLFLDAKTGFPVKLEFVEPHYLWGQQRIEYLWSTWTMTDGVALPGAAFRLVDGETELSQTTGTTEIVAASAAPPLAAPPAPSSTPSDLPRYLQPIPPEAISVSAGVSLLTNAGYTEAVALVGDDVFVFDATQGEARARLDQQLIERLFPGRRNVTVVVTDTAWPHVAGVRYWVSQGATVAAHAAAASFLQRVIERRWTLAPDALERARSSGRAAPLKLIAIDRPTELGGGRVRLVPIDGIGSEVALMAYLPEAKFLWASDYIQTLDTPSLYAAEVLRAADRVGITPERVAAQHLALTNWSAVRAAQRGS
jgi:hypothetical protein